MRTANTICVEKTVPFLQSLQSFLKLCDSADLSFLLDRSLFSGVQNLLGASLITKGNVGVWFLASLQTFQFVCSSSSLRLVKFASFSYSLALSISRNQMFRLIRSLSLEMDLVKFYILVRNAMVCTETINTVL